MLADGVAAGRRRADADDEAQAQADRREVRGGDRGALHVGFSAMPDLQGPLPRRRRRASRPHPRVHRDLAQLEAGAAELVARYEVIAPTAAGQRGAAAPRRLRLPDARAVDDTEAPLERPGPGDRALVGNSMGGGSGSSWPSAAGRRSVVRLAPAGGWRAGAAGSQSVSTGSSSARWRAPSVDAIVETGMARPSAPARAAQRHAPRRAPPPRRGARHGARRAGL